MCNELHDDKWRLIPNVKNEAPKFMMINWTKQWTVLTAAAIDEYVPLWFFTSIHSLIAFFYLTLLFHYFVSILYFFTIFLHKVVIYIHSLTIYGVCMRILIFYWLSTRSSSYLFLTISLAQHFSRRVYTHFTILAQLSSRDFLVSEFLHDVLYFR